MTTLLDCIKRIPLLIYETTNQYPSNFSSLEELSGSIKEVIFIASGSSYNAAFTAQFYLEKECGLKVKLFYPNVFNKIENLETDKDKLYIFISQSGTTKLVYENLIKAKKLGCNTLSITSSKETPISKESMYFIDMGCKNEEYRYRTIGFSMTVVVCWLLGMYLSSKNNCNELFKVADSLSKIIDDTLEWYQNNKFELMKRNIAFFTGANSLWPISSEADIKFMEMIPYITKTYELEEFMHGPQNVFDNSHIFFVLVKSGVDTEKSIAMAKFLKSEIGNCYLIGNEVIDKKDFNIENCCGLFYELQYICFFQVVAFMLANDRGRDLKVGLNTSISKYLQKSL
ncbi:MAG: SIS domain-containing protein [Clostridium sp.]|nr:SIS domain-containing protein [Clostridium sp.]MDU3546402.1 SIS domain-containing protein [Clostridium sp.]